MARADDAQKAERLNLAWELLRHLEAPEVAGELVQRCNISKRQAYRYLQMAQEMRAPVPIGDAKIPFTVKLRENLVKRLRRCVKRSRSTLSEVVSQAVIAWLDRGRGRG